MKKNRGIDLARLLKTYLTFLSLSITIAVMGLPLMTSPLLAQDTTESAQQSSRQKPKLVKINVNEDNNDPEAEKIVKIINPSFFDYDKKYMGGSPDIFFFSDFITLKSNQPKKFILLTARKSPYYCTKYGCTHILYENIGENKWIVSAQFVATSVYYDDNAIDDRAKNIITRGFSPQSGNTTDLWLWDGIKYIKAKKKEAK